MMKGATGLLVLVALSTLMPSVNAADAAIETAVAKRDWSESSVAALWGHVLATADHEKIMDAYTVVRPIKESSDEARAEVCAENHEALQLALEVNQISPALHEVAADCARARGDASSEGYHVQAFAALAQHALAKAAPQNGHYSVVVLSEIDAFALIEGSGFKYLYGYYDIHTQGRTLPFVTALWDEEEKVERIYEFDYLDAQVQLRRDEKLAAFPVFRRVMARSFIDVYGETPGTDAANALALRQALEQLELAARMRSVEQLARQGDFAAVRSYVYACIAMRYEDCGSRSVDLLLPWAENKVAGALVLLAAIQAEGLGVKRNLKMATELLDLADARLGDGRGTIDFFDAQNLSGKNNRTSAFALKRLHRLAKAGNLPVYPRLAQALIANDKTKPLAKDTRAGLERAAEAEIASAQHLLGAILIDEKQLAKGIQWIERSASSGYLPAQLFLARRYASKAFGNPDFEQAAHWHAEAATSGSSESMRWLATHYGAREKTPDNRLRAELWWQSAAYQGDIDASIQLAQLDIAGGEGANGNPERGEQLLREVLARQDRPDARRELADLLIRGADGVAKNLGEARKLLLVDAEKGDALSQLHLGSHIQSGRLGDVAGDGAAWIAKAESAEDPEVLLELGSVYYYQEKVVPTDKRKGITLWERARAKNSRMASNNLAWAYCTVDDDALFDAPRGLALIQPLVGEDQQYPPAFLDTLAACHAANAEFDTAAMRQDEAVAIVQSIVSADDRVLKRMRDRAELYKARSRYVEREPEG
jgi:TPR repeat protein